MANNNRHNDEAGREHRRLGIVCPMANERSTAARLIEEVLEHCSGFEWVRFFAVFDKSCTDGTFDMLGKWRDKPAELELVWAPQDNCVVDAYVKGYTEAIQAGCEWILEIDAGFSHRPDEIPQFFEKMAAGYDCVFGSRFCEGGGFSDAPFSRYLISRGGSYAANLLLGTKLADMTSGFEMFSSDVMSRLLAKGIKSRGHFFQTEIKAYCRNFRTSEVPIHYSKPSQRVGFGVLLDALRNLYRLLRLRTKGQLYI